MLLPAKEQIDYKQFFNLTNAPYGLRGHKKKLVKDRSRLDSRKYFFSQRVINRWNSLPAKVVNSESVNSFKKPRPLLLQRYGCLGGAAVQRRTRDQKVAGSTPGRGAIKSTRSTQPSIPPGWVNRVSAYCMTGVKAGCVHLCQVTGNTV